MQRRLDLAHSHSIRQLSDAPTVGIDDSATRPRRMVLRISKERPGDCTAAAQRQGPCCIEDHPQLAVTRQRTRRQGCSREHLRFVTGTRVATARRQGRRRPESIRERGRGHRSTPRNISQAVCHLIQAFEGSPARAAPDRGGPHRGQRHPMFERCEPCRPSRH